MQQISAESLLTPQGWRSDATLSINSSGIIEAIEPGLAEGALKVGVLLPSPPNLHSHAFQRAMAGMTEARGPDPNDSFWTWRKLMYDFLDRLTPDDIEDITAFVQMEMLEAGYASVGEFHYVHHQNDGKPYDNLAELSERVVAATAMSGAGLTLLPVLYEYGGCDRRNLSGGQLWFGNLFDRFQKLHDHASRAVGTLPADCAIGVAPHSLRAVSVENLANAAALAGNNPLHMHIAEQVAEVEEVKDTWGARPVEWLLDNQAVGTNWCLIHCTQMTPDETRALAATGAVAGLCPITESSLGDGIFDGVNYAKAGGHFGIGSDSNIRISLAEELRTLEYSQRLRDRGRAMFATPEKSTGRVMFEHAARDGARAIGRNCGTIETGKLADLLALDAQNINLEGKSQDQLLDSFIFAGDDRLVTDVWSAGRHLVQAGRHLHRDRITGSYRDTLNRLREQI